MRTQIATTTEEASVKVPKENGGFYHVTVPVGTEVQKVFGAIGYVDSWTVTDYNFILNDVVRYAAQHYGIVVSNDHVEFPE